MSRKIYVGFAKGFREVFRAETVPDEKSHGHIYNAVMGPFRTVRGAKAEVHFGFANPHIQHVRDAERIGKKYAENLAKLPMRNDRLG